MYVFGIDIPLIEVIVGVGVVGIILLLEITVVLLLITYLMRNSKRLETKISSLVTALSSLNKAEISELKKIKELKAKSGIKKKLGSRLIDLKNKIKKSKK